MPETAELSGQIHGEKLYQQRAKMALPLLVRQAFAKKPITYEDLAGELGMPNPRNLNFVLGSIGQTLQHLSETEDRPVPPIQCLVVNKASGLPGEGIGWFLDRESLSTITADDYTKLNKTDQRQVVEDALPVIYKYRHWLEVLEKLSLAPVDSDNKSLVAGAKNARGHGGEGELHRKLKEHVAQNPSEIGVLPKTLQGETEVPLASGDRLDVFFRGAKTWTAVEVKSRISGDDDLSRGIFQCIKYHAVLRAELVARNCSREVRTILVVEEPLSKELTALKNQLGVEVLILDRT